MQVDSDAAAARPTGLAGNGSKVCARVRGLAKNGSKEVCLCTRVCLRVNKRQEEHLCFSIKILPYQGLLHGAFLFPLILSNSSIIRT